MYYCSCTIQQILHVYFRINVRFGIFFLDSDVVSSSSSSSGSFADSDSCGRFVVKFTKPIRAITPGQICALYAGRGGILCLGGGPITDRGLTYMERGLDVSLYELHPSGDNDLSLSHMCIK